MQKSKQYAFAFVVGYFVPFFPLHYVLSGTLTDGLTFGILGLIGAILILKFGDQIL